MPVIEPSLAEVVRAAMEGKLRDVHTALPGRVKTYDGTKQVADVVPVVNGVIFTADDEPVSEELPVIPNVPVAWPRGGGYSFQFPLHAGDHGLLIFNESCISQWRVSGETSDPGDLRRHDLSYPIFIPCIAPDSAPLPPLSGNEGAIDCAGTFRVGGPAADFVAQSTKVDAAISQLASFCAAVQATLTGGVGTPAGPGSLVVPLTASAPTPASTAATKLKGE